MCPFLYIVWEYVVGCQVDNCLCTKCIFVISLSWGSAMMSFRSAIKTPPPWLLQCFRIAS